MDLSRPYRVIRSRLDLDVLLALSGTSRPLTGREVAVFAHNRSPSGTLLTLNHLVEHGVVYRQEAGNAFLYTLNRDHLIIPALDSLFDIKLRFYDFLKDAFEGWELPAVHASLFGSMARGEGDTDSDIDLFIVKPVLDQSSEARWRNQINDLADAIFERTGNRAGIAELSIEDIKEFRVSGRPIVTELVKTAITYYGINLAELLTEER